MNACSTEQKCFLIIIVGLDKTLNCFFYSSVFDDEDENKLSYTEIHHQYKKLVSRLKLPCK